MPGLNHRGPIGEGPMTGRGLGRCNRRNKGLSDAEVQQNHDLMIDRSVNSERGLGQGRGMRNGRGSALGRGDGLGKGMRNRGNS
jgi:hypothetical protein